MSRRKIKIFLNYLVKMSRELILDWKSLCHQKKIRRLMTLIRFNQSYYMCIWFMDRAWLILLTINILQMRLLYKIDSYCTVTLEFLFQSPLLTKMNWNVMNYILHSESIIHLALRSRSSSRADRASRKWWKSNSWLPNRVRTEKRIDRIWRW